MVGSALLRRLTGDTGDTGEQLITRSRAELDLTSQPEVGNHYGYGVWITESEAAQPAYHVTGWDPGVALFSAVHPARGIGITILANHNVPIDSIYRNLARICVP